MHAPAVRRWFAAWGRFFRRNARIALRATGRASVTAARGLARGGVRFVVATGHGTIAIGSGVAHAIGAVARLSGIGAARAWSASRSWARTNVPAIRRWFAAWGRFLRRNALLALRALGVATLWTAGRSADLGRSILRTLGRLARWWIRTGAPATARGLRRGWRASRRGLRVSAVGVARWTAGKRRQSVRGWARAKRWTRATLRFIARVARATWAGPLRWTLVILVKVAEGALRWLDRRNDDLPLD